MIQLSWNLSATFQGRERKRKRMWESSIDRGCGWSLAQGQDPKQLLNVSKYLHTYTNTPDTRFS